MNEKFEPGPHNVVFEGEVVGQAELDENGRVVSASLSSEGIKKVLPDYDPTAGLSLGFSDDYAKAYFEQNPDAPRTYSEAYFEQNPDAPRTYEDAYYRNRPKGTFDA